MRSISGLLLIGMFVFSDGVQGQETSGSAADFEAHMAMIFAGIECDLPTEREAIIVRQWREQSLTGDDNDSDTAFMISETLNALMQRQLASHATDVGADCAQTYKDYRAHPWPAVTAQDPVFAPVLIVGALEAWAEFCPLDDESQSRIEESIPSEFGSDASDPETWPLTDQVLAGVLLMSISLQLGQDAEEGPSATLCQIMLGRILALVPLAR